MYVYPHYLQFNVVFVRIVLLRAVNVEVLLNILSLLSTAELCFVEK